MVTQRVSIGAFGRGALTASLGVLACLALDCNDPHSPATNDSPAYRGQFAGGELRLESPSTGQTPLRLVVTEVVLDVPNHRVHAWVGIRNSGLEPVAGPHGIAVFDFTPEDVVPANGACIVCITTPCPTYCIFDHRGTYGDDGLLAAGETSTPVEWIFANPSDESFAFRAEIANGPAPTHGRISGVVFRDLDLDGQRDSSEPGLQGAFVTLHHGQDSQFVQSDPDGRYAFRVAEPGLYELVYGCFACGVPEILCRLTTPPSRQVLVVRRPDGTLSSFDRGDFGCAGAIDERPHVAGVVFDDLNRNGQRDRGEPGMPGVRIVSASVFCDIAPAETRTDARGFYIVVLPGCAPWQVEHDPLAGFVDTTPNPVRVQPWRDPPQPGDPLPVRQVDFGVAPAVRPRSF